VESPVQIIVLDAEGQSREIAERLLAARGQSVLATDDPYRVADMAGHATIELLLVDMESGGVEPVPRGGRRRDDPETVFPSGPGYAILRSVERVPFPGRWPLALLAADPFRRRFGVIDVVPKPLDGEALRLKVASALADEAPPPRTPRVVASDAEEPLGFDAVPRALRSALVVDGDARFRQWIRGLMAIHGFKVHEAEDAQEGLRRALAERPWLILVEVALPGPVDGVTLCQQVRSHSLTSHTPLLFLSERDDYRERYRALSAGADDFLSKRITAREILIRMQLVLKRYADVGARVGRGNSALEGRVEAVGAPGVLQMCNLGQLSGVLTIRTDSRTAEFRFREGEIVGARAGGANGAEAVYDFIAWAEGRFHFLPGDPVAPTPLGQRFDHLLLEGCRRLDERRRAG
jgi:DNA-binding response OmpR family regulator